MEGFEVDADMYSPVLLWYHHYPSTPWGWDLHFGNYPMGIHSGQLVIDFLAEWQWDIARYVYCKKLRIRAETDLKVPFKGTKPREEIGKLEFKFLCFCNNCISLRE